MTDQALSVACFNAILQNKVSAPEQWDLEGAIKMRSALFALPGNIIPVTTTAIDVYNAVLPMYDYRTTDDDTFMPSFGAPTMVDLKNALDYGVEGTLNKVRLSKVEGYFDEKGLFTPMAIWWSDGLRYDVDFKERREGHSEKVGGIGTRYVVMVPTKNVTHKRILLQDETGIWYVESQK